MKPTVIFLTVVMQRGFGVSVMIEEVSRRLIKQGIKVIILCERFDNQFPDLDVQVLQDPLTEILRVANNATNSVIITLTSPYFEIVPEISQSHPCIIWEAGDPTPSLFPNDSSPRQLICDNKYRNVYPKARNVLTISDFIKHDINWSDSETITLGCDHVPYVQPKDFDYFADLYDRRLKVGALMRIGPGEASYKGNQQFLELSSILKETGIPVELHMAGRGEAVDAAAFKRAGFHVQLNLNESEKFNYLRELDVFVSLSLWEGFNLPLIEAQGLGTFSLCLDTGAHPEVAPYMCSSLNEIVAFIKRAHLSANFLHTSSRLCYEFVKKEFLWGRTTNNFLKKILTVISCKA